jgi:hypothetical protein
VDELSKSENTFKIDAGEPAAVQDDRLEWETPSLVLASARNTDHASNGGSDGGVFPAPDSAS